MTNDSLKPEVATSATKMKVSSTGGNTPSKLDAFLSASASPSNVVASVESQIAFGLTEPAKSVPKISSLVPPKETTIPKQVKTSSLIQPAPVPSRRASRIRGSERGA